MPVNWEQRENRIKRHYKHNRKNNKNSTYCAAFDVGRTAQALKSPGKRGFGEAATGPSKPVVDY